MSDENKQTPHKPYYTHRPVTRRQLLAQGFIKGASFMALPSVMDILCGSSPAVADQLKCPTPDPNDNGRVPLFIIDMAGGANLCREFIPRREDGVTLLNSMNIIGLSNGNFNSQINNESFNTEFGIPLNTVGNSFLNRLSELSATARAKTSIGIICGQSQDDSRENGFNIGGVVQNASSPGSLISSGIGTTNRRSGGNSNSASFSLNGPPLQRVSRVSDLSGAVNIGGALGNLTDLQKTAVASSLSRLTAEQAKRLNKMTLGEQFSTLTQCGYIKNIDFATDASAAVNPINDPDLAAANFNVTDPEDGFVGGVVKSVMGAVAGIAATFEVGGADYHQQGIATRNRVNNVAATLIRNIIAYADRIQKRVAILLYTDGAIGCQANNEAPNNDNGGPGMSVMFAYNPQAKPTLLNNGQAGHFTNGQVADASATNACRTPDGMSAVAFATWLNLQNRLSELNNFVPTNILTASEAERYVLFG